MVENCLGNLRFEVTRKAKIISIPVNGKWQELNVAEIKSAILDCGPCGLKVPLIAQDQDPRRCDLKAKQMLGHQLPLSCPRLFLESTLSS